MSWNQLENIIKENRDDQRRAAQDAPVACPIDGAVLDIHPKTGMRNCPFGNYRWQGGAK